MDKIAEHKKICDGIHELFKQKNAAYGDSSSNTYDEFGLITYAIRLNDKFNRFKTLVKNPDINKGDESIEDTLLDMANYCMLAVIDERRKTRELYTSSGYVLEEKLKKYIERTDNGIAEIKKQYEDLYG